MPERRIAAIGSSFWPTPRASEVGAWQTDGKNIMLTLDGGRALTSEQVLRKGTTEKGKRQVGLENVAKLWPTPTTADIGRGSGTYPRGNDTLTGAMRKWPTPRAEDSESCGNHSGASDSLTGETRDWKGESAKSWRDRESGDTTPTLADHVADLYSSHTPPRQTQRKRGKPICERSRVLNPRFVEALMGWPMGWSIASIDSACSATASSPTKPPSASSSSTNACAEVV